MKYLDEYRDAELAGKLTAEIRRTVTRPAVLMEVCGGQTHSIVKYGLDELLPREVELVHGPGCPVCVTPLEMIDRAHAIARRPGVIFCSFGDMLRVPGSQGDLFQIKARGRRRARGVFAAGLPEAGAGPSRRARWCSSPSASRPRRRPMPWRCGRRARRASTNFSVLVSHVLVPPAIRGILESPDNRVQAFLGPGHVCAVMGWREYEPLAARYRVPIVITGFEPLDLLEGILMAVRQLEAGPRGGGEPVRPRGDARRQSGGAADDRAGLRSLRPGMARHRRHPAERLPPARGVRGVRCRTHFSSSDGIATRGAGGLHQRTGAARR